MSQGQGGGPPTRVLSEDEINQVEKLAALLSIEHLADYLGVGKTTFYAIMERQPEVAERYKEGKAKAIAGVSKALLTAALNGDAVRQMFYLKTQAGWKETKVLEGTLEQDVKITEIRRTIVKPNDT